MSNTFTIDGISLTAAGVASLSFDFANLGDDTVTLKLVDDGVQRRAWAFGARVVIKLDEALFFTGWVSSAPAASMTADEGVSVTISGPWWWLKRIVFGREYAGEYYTSCNLFIDIDNNLQTPIMAMREALAWAAQASGLAFAMGTLNPSIADLRTPAPEFIEGEYCDAVVKKIAGWLPEAALWVDYTKPVPVFNWTAPGARATHTFTRGSKPLTSAQMTKDDSIAPTGVIVRYDADHDEYASAAISLYDDKFPPDVTPKTPGVAVLTLKDSDWLGIDFAPALFQMAQTFLWSGTVQAEAQMLDAKPGDIIYLAGRSEWAGCAALVQRVTFSTPNLDFAITCGAPSHLGLDELRDLFWWVKKATADATADIGSRASFTCYRTTDKTRGNIVRIAAGNIDTGSTTVVPTWNGVRLDATEFPYEKFERGYSRSFYLKIVWRCDVEEFTGVNAIGQEVTGYRPTSTGTIISAEIVTARADNTAPQVTLAGGRQTDGTFYFPIATAREVNNELDVTQHRNADLNILFIPPNRLMLLNG